ncbi:MAG TPA: tetratricopeptide repeat protein [Gemmatimonadaceae bacterium]|nr:tetratricopeptide repeat protein [Gemmatimonadaceae bacterium]
MPEPRAATTAQVEILRTFARRIDATDPGAQNNLGVLYFRRGMFDEAIAAFSRALALDERMRVARRNLEIAYGEAGLLEQRTADLEQRLVEAPDDISALVESGIAQKSTGNLDLAEAKFRRALQHDPESSVLHFFIAEILYNRGSGEEALRFLRRSIDLNPANPDSHYLAGFILGDLGMLEEAREANRRAVALNPRLTRAEANLSLDTLRAGNSAVKRGAPADEAKASIGSPHLTLALALRVKGYHAEALRECRAALESGEDPGAALESIASLHLFLRRPADALAACERRISLGGASPRVLNQRGIALYLLGRTSEAEQTFRSCIGRAKAYAAGQNNLGALLWDGGHVREATNCFRRAVRDDASLESARLNLALALFRQGHLQLALDAYRSLLHDHPDHPRAWSGIGRVLLEFGDHARARDACVRAVQAEPTLAHAHVTLSAAFAGLGDEAGAAECAEQAHRLDPRAQAETMILEMDSPESTAAVATMGAAGAAVPDYTLGRDYLSKGLHERAMAETRRAMARGADEKEGMVLLARCSAARGDYDVAEKELSAALGAGPSDEAVAVELAAVHRAMGRPRDALRRVVGLLRSNVYHFAALIVLGEALLDLKRTRDAARAFARVLKFNPNHAAARKYSHLTRLENI